VKKLRIELDPAIFDELCLLAREERRSPADQVAWIVQHTVKQRVAHARAMRQLEDRGPAAVPPILPAQGALPEERLPC
jgi:hypothetical protein